MGGQNRYASSNGVAAAPQQQVMGGYSTLPEYQAPSAKAHHQKNVSSAAQQPALRGPRAHLAPKSVPAFPQHPQQPQQQQGLTPEPRSPMDSPTSTSSSNNQQQQQQQRFHYNPYDTMQSRVACQYANCGYYCDQAHNQPQNQIPNQQYGSGEWEQQQQGEFPPVSMQNMEQNYPHGNEPPMQSQLPYGTLHACLETLVTFVPYPTEEFQNPGKTQPPTEGNMSRVFLGQLPYQVTDMQLDWLCYTFGNGGSVYYPERITKHDPMRGCKVPTGCIHAYADNECVSSMLNTMHKRILVDDTGVWFADGPEQQAVLNDYCLMMKNDRTKRYQNRPYDTVVAQFATSSFVRRR